MNIPRCSLSSWKNLYDAADAFREIACWDWMSDADLFGVQNPNRGEIGYCCVLGEFGEVFGLVVYLGSAGLEQQRKIQSGKIHAGLSDAVYSQNCLTAWFGGRSELDKNDLKVVKDLGRKFRGGDAWPQFRSMQPGYIPWFLTEDEVRFLTLCLTQARQVALRFGKDPNYLTAPGKNVCLVQVPKQKTDSRSVAQPSGSSVAPGQQTLFPEAAENLEFEWDSQWLAPAPLVKTTVRPVPLDELRLQRIKKTSQGHRGIWEIDSFFTPSPVDNGDRPFLPFTLLCAERDSGMILGTVLAEVKTWEAEFSKAFLESIEEHKILPTRLSLRKEELRQLFAPLAAQLGIEIELTKKLTAVDRAKRGLLKFMEGRL
ncbi:MAG: DUF7309 domain-containing protein [Candidatus Binatia bacterium]